MAPTKKMAFILLMLFIILSSQHLQITKATEHDVYPGQSIQKAINNANPGDTIIIHSGEYKESIEINKTIFIIGENPTTTILDGSGLQYPVLMQITAPNVTIANLTVRKASETEHYGILLSDTVNVSLKNLIIRENYRGIVLNNVSNSEIYKTVIIKNTAYAITLLQNSNNNVFVNDTVMENPTGVSIETSCMNNWFYHNNFINNVIQVDPMNYGTNTKWNNTYPIGGNYWSDYIGQDDDGDGIGDTPYTKEGANDYLPLMNPWGALPPIAKFTYKPQIAAINEKITFNASESYDIDGKIENYTWDFGDGNITSVTTPIIEHAYTLYGNYTVALRVTDNHDLNDTTTAIIQIKKKTSTLTIDIQPQELEIDESVTITGNLTIEGHPAADENVTILKRKQDQTNWENFTTVITNIDGTYQHIWTPTDTGNYELIASWQGNETTLPTNSTIVTLIVTKRRSEITIFATPQEIYIGENITITGQLKPAAEGMNITLEYQKIYSSTNLTVWKTLNVVQTNSTGNYIYTWQPEEVAMYLLRVSWLGDNVTFECSNITGLINVNPSPSSITINAEPQKITLGATITISGIISPPRSYVNVTIHVYFVNETTSWKITAQTDLEGTYRYIWKPESEGTYQIKASWQGDNSTSSSESEIITVIVENPPKIEAIYLFAFLIGAILLAVLLWKNLKK